MGELAHGWVRSLLGVVVATLLGLGCASPNRGIWTGTFDGSVAGTVEFRINTSGTKLTGTMTGTTTDGAAFRAKMKGKITEDTFFYATFTGTAESSMRPIPFAGFLRGELGAGRAKGEWECELRFTGSKFSGTWQTSQGTGE